MDRLKKLVHSPATNMNHQLILSLLYPEPKTVLLKLSLLLHTFVDLHDKNMHQLIYKIIIEVSLRLLPVLPLLLVIH